MLSEKDILKFKQIVEEKLNIILTFDEAKILAGYHRQVYLAVYLPRE